MGKKKEQEELERLNKQIQEIKYETANSFEVNQDVIDGRLFILNLDCFRYLGEGKP